MAEKGDGEEEGGKVIFPVPTNISYVVPAHYVINGLKIFAEKPSAKLPQDTLSLDEMLKQYKKVDTSKEARSWVIKEAKTEEINPTIQEYKKFLKKDKTSSLKKED